MALTGALAALCCWLGCRHETHPASPLPGPYRPEPVKIRRPKLTVLTNQEAPIHYRWTYTNRADGTTVLQFTPAR